MKDSFGRAVGTCIVGLGLLAFVIAAPASDTNTAAGANPPAMSTSTAGAQTGAAVADSVIASWPDASNKVAKAMIDKYGQPNEVSNSLLVWNDNGPWKQTIVYRDGVAHNFPIVHADVLKQTISYRVPLDKYNDLARFNGSVTADRTAGLLSSTADREDMNFLALNLSNDIIRGNKSVDEARRFYGKTATLAMTGKSSPYTQGLLFKVTKGDNSDPDHATIRQPGTGEIQQTQPGNQPTAPEQQQPTAPPSPY